MLACVGFLAVHAATGKVRLRRGARAPALDMPWVAPAPVQSRSTPSVARLVRCRERCRETWEIV